MTVDEYYACAKDLLVATQAVRRIRERMGDFAVHAQHATWDCLDAITRELWDGFDATHPDEPHNPFGGPDWNDPPGGSLAPLPPTGAP